MEENIVLDRYLSINNLKILLIFFLMGIACLYLFKDKEITLKNITNKMSERSEYFKNILIELYLPVFAGILVNFIIKLAIFYSVLDNIQGDISFLVIGVSFIYLAGISLFIGALYILAQLTLKDKIKAVFFPLFIIDVLIIVFSFGAFLLGESIPFIKNFINLIFYPILKLIDGFFFNFKFELMYFENQIVILLLIVIMTAVALLFAYKAILEFSKEKFELEIRSEIIRKFIFISVAAIITTSFVIAILIVFSLAFNNVKVFNAIVIGEIISVILTPLVYTKLDKFYRERQISSLNIDNNGTVSLSQGRDEEAVSRFDSFSFKGIREEGLSKGNERREFSVEAKERENRIRKKKNTIEVKTKRGSKTKSSVENKAKVSKKRRGKNKK